MLIEPWPNQRQDAIVGPEVVFKSHASFWTEKKKRELLQSNTPDPERDNTMKVLTRQGLIGGLRIVYFFISIIIQSHLSIY